MCVLSRVADMQQRDSWVTCERRWHTPIGCAECTDVTELFAIADDTRQMPIFQADVLRLCYTKHT
jgi:hypothetical protein